MRKTSWFMLFIFAGIMAAASSLFVSLMLFGSTSSQINPEILFFLVVIEELVKFFFLYFVTSMSKVRPATVQLVLAAIFGFGFALFETFLILLSGKEITPTLVFLFLVHMATSMLLSFGITDKQQQNYLLKTFIFILLAIILHVCYNLIVAIKV